MGIERVECYYLRGGHCDEKYRNSLVEALNFPILFHEITEQNVQHLVALGVRTRTSPIFLFLDATGKMVSFECGLLKPVHIMCCMNGYEKIYSRT